MLKIAGYIEGEQLCVTESSVVVRAHRLKDNLPVVIKYSTSDFPSLKEIARYRNEFDLLREIHSPQVIRAYELKRLGNRMLLVAEDFRGQSLAKYFSSGSVPLQDFLQIAISITDGIAAIHSSGIIHKDICPANILINPETKEVKIIDLGISTRLSRESQEFKNFESISGTLSYVSPEQTGRMNRDLDYRTDLYSAGATFYHFLTGMPPFAGTDALELVYSHIAKEVRPLCEVNSKIPKILSEIIGKLLSKAAEDRYKSACGLKSDLQHCLQDFKEHSEIRPFTLAQQDISLKLEIPQRIFGRKKELDELLNSFARVSQGGNELLLVGGYSGIGKSLLIKEIHKPIVKQRGYFISGKYDQFNRSVPYSAMSQAIGQLLQSILMESEEKVTYWKKRITTTLGPNGRIIVDMIPVLQQLIGPQPAVPELSPAETQNRFHLVFQNFIGAIAQAQHPLVVFLDDLQWADSSSLQLLEKLLCQGKHPHLLIILSYRSNEVDKLHPFTLVIEEVKKQQTIAVNEIQLDPLEIDDTGELISAALRTSSQQALPLTKLIFKKTAGNPFFLTQFLYSLYENQLLNLDPASGSWKWDIGEIEKMGISDNIVDLMTSRVNRMPESCKEILKSAACIGNKFDLKILSSIAQKPYHLTAQDIWPALRDGLIVPVSEDYFIAHELTSTSSISNQETESAKEVINDSLQKKIAAGHYNVRYRFLHDRVQQACYLLIPDEQTKSEHLKIGRLMLENLIESQLDEEIFEILVHFNSAIELISDKTEKLKLAELNLRAGLRAKASSAIKVAAHHFSIAIGLLDPSEWGQNHQLMFELHKNQAECEYLIGNFAESDRLATETIAKAKSKLDKAQIYSNRIQLFMTQGSDIPKAVQTGIEALKLFDFNIPIAQDAKNLECGERLKKLNERLHGIEIASLFDLPAATDAEKRVVLDLLVITWAAAYYSQDPTLAMLLIYETVLTSLEHGHTDASAMGYLLHGMVLSLGGDYRQGYAFGLLAKKLNDEKFPNLAYKLKVGNVFAHSLNPYFNHFETCMPYYLNAFKIGPQIGELLYTAWGVLHIILLKTMTGDNLNEVFEESEKYLGFVQNINDPNMTMAYKFHRHIVRSLIGGTKDSATANADEFSEANCVEHYQKNGFHAGLLWYGIYKTFLQVQMGEFAKALDTSKMAEELLPYDIGLWSTTNHFFYQSLAIFKAYPKMESQQKTECDFLLKRNLEKFRMWSDTGAVNFLHRYQLLLAEMAKLEGRWADAAGFYDKSIENAAKGRFVQDEALTLEWAAHFYLSRERKRIFQVYLTDAYYAYSRWGAVAKTQLLEMEFSGLLLISGNSPSAPGSKTLDTTTLVMGDSLDLATVTKAAQVISREVAQGDLLLKLMSILIENAGAERGFLILSRMGKLMIEAEAEGQRTALTNHVFEEHQGLLHGAVNYVKRTQKNLVLSDATTDNRFSEDEYVIRTHPKSVLCLPIINQGRFHGMAYFENNLTSNAFTANRLTVLELLLAQAAISIENADLYQELNHRIQEKDELNSSLEKMITIANSANAAKSLFLANISHELRTPMHGILSFAKFGIQKNETATKEKLKSYFVEIYDSGSRLMSLLNDLLDLAKLEAGKATYSMTEMNLVEVVQSVSTEMAAFAEEKEIKIKLMSNAANFMGSYDADKLMQVIRNLLSNAIKFSEKESTIFIKLHRTEETNICEIINRGAEIPEAELTSIFDKFIQSSVTRTGAGGTGLGLAICKEIVLQHGGKIWAENTADQQTKFIFELPRLIEGAAQQVA
jgi:predicted ATPase/signal transduction histidine kinase